MTPAAIAVLGAGAWGTALAIALARNQHPVRLWARSSRVVQQINLQHTNDHLPHITLPKLISADTDLVRAINQVDTIYLALPSHAIGQLCKQLAPLLQSQQGLCLASKGLDKNQQFLSDVIGQHCPKAKLAIVSGPSFALEMARNLVTILTIASHDSDFVGKVALQLKHPHLRLYLSDDLTGVQIAGTVKNILAIAAGLCDGLGLGANARAALVTRGLHEMMRLASALGAKANTLLGPAGLGDLMLTCSDNQSRNRRFGVALGQGCSQQQALKDIAQVVEGLKNCETIWQLAQQHQIEMPITEQVYRVLYQEVPPENALATLLARDSGINS